MAALRALYTEMPEPLRKSEDRLAVRLVAPSLARLVRTLAKSPKRAERAHRWIGIATLGLTYGIPLRTARIDDVVREGASQGSRQLVVLGAGLDARAWRLGELGDSVVFELDFEATQRFKRDGVGSERSCAREVRFCPIDFERQTIGEVLADARFDPAQTSTWIWEGVTMYLTPDAIDGTLDAISALAAKGSRLVLTYSPPLTGPSRWATAGFKAAGEEIRGLMSPNDVERRVRARGFRVVSNQTMRELAERFWPPKEARWIGDFERVLVVERQ